MPTDSVTTVAAVAVPIAVAVLGLLVGSFLNVVIARVPERRSIVSPPSSCPSCDTPIRPYDNIPVVSWLILRGRCRTCGTSISAQYPIVEATNALVWVALYFWFAPLTGGAVAVWDTVIAIVFSSFLLVLAVIDIHTKKLPNPIQIGLAGTGVVLVVAAAAATGDWGRALNAAIGAVVAFAVFYLIMVIGERAAKRPAFGMGDVKLSFSLGLYLGWYGTAYIVVGIFLGFVLGAVFGVILMRVGRAGRKTAIPFGNWLAVGAVLAIFVAQPIADWYLGLLGR